MRIPGKGHYCEAHVAAARLPGLSKSHIAVNPGDAQSMLAAPAAASRIPVFQRYEPKKRMATLWAWSCAIREGYTT